MNEHKNCRDELISLKLVVVFLSSLYAGIEDQKNLISLVEGFYF